MLYRIQTESSLKFDENIVSIIQQYYSSFTLIHSIGYWMGTVENSIIIEIVTDGLSRHDVMIEHICGMILSSNKQEAILMTRFNVHSKVYNV